jgi:hypothetical protein
VPVIGLKVEGPFELKEILEEKNNLSPHSYFFHFSSKFLQSKEKPLGCSFNMEISLNFVRGKKRIVCFHPASTDDAPRSEEH